MKRTMLAIALLLAASASATTVYVSQSGGVFSGGTACNGQTAVSIATFNASTPTADEHVYICGTLTTFLGVYGSGTSGHPIVVTWDSGARITLPYCNGWGSKCIDLGTNSYITLDGGIACGPGTACSTAEAGSPTGYPSGLTGIIEATANGSGLANQVTPVQAIASSGSNIEVKNIIIRNVYQHTSFADNTGGAGDVAGWQMSGVSNNLLHDSTIHDVSAGLNGNGGPTTNISVYNNYLWNINWGVAQGTTTGQTQSNWLIYNNHFGATANWDNSGNTYHHDRIFLYDNCSGCGNFSGVYIYNNLFDGPSGNSSTSQMYFGGGQQQNTYIFNNFFNNGGQSTHIDNALLEATGEATQTVWIYNNTVVGAGTSIDDQLCSIVQGHLVFENNASESCAALLLLQDGTYGTGPPTIVTLDYNAYGNGLSDIWQWSGHTSENTLAAWQTETGKEAHSSYTAGGLSLNSNGTPQAGSPVIGAAANLYSVCNGQPNPGLGALCYDMAGNPRPVSAAWDEGAYKYSTPSNPNPPSSITAVPH